MGDCCSLICAISLVLNQVADQFDDDYVTNQVANVT